MKSINTIKKKLNNKTFLNAIITSSGVIIILLTTFLTFLSICETRCNNEYQIMLINKTQSYVEAEKILIERCQAASNRAGFEAKGEKDLVTAWSEEIAEYRNEYEQFKADMISYDSVIEQKGSSCSGLSTWVNVGILIIMIVAFIQLYFSIEYTKKYLNDK